MPNHGDLKIWWIPQIPGRAFEVPVPDLASAALLLNTLGDYDAFQFESSIKPDYCNVGGLLEYDAGVADWFDWECTETFDSFDQVRRDPERLASAIDARSDETAEQAQPVGQVSGAQSADAQPSPSPSNHGA